MEVHRDLTMENQMVLLPEVNRLIIIIKIFRDSNHHTGTPNLKKEGQYRNK